MNGIAINTLLISLGLVAGGITGAFLLYRFFRWLATLADRSRYQIDGLVLRIVGRPLSVLVGLASVNYALYRIPEVQALFDRGTGVQNAILILTGTWIVASLVKAIVREYGLPLAERTDTDVDERVVALLDLTAVYLIWTGGILIAFREVGIEVTAFIASLGIVGLAVALAARTVLSNVLAGVTLTADRHFRVGDRIEVGDHIGDVLEINLHKTVIRTRDNEIVLIPNDVLGKEVIINHMLPEQVTRIEMTIGVAYDSDVDQATAILHEILRSSDRIHSDPGPEVNVAALGDNAIVLQILAWIDRPRGKRTVRDAVYRKTLARFAEAGIEIPFPQRTLHVAPSSQRALLGEHTRPSTS